MKTASVKIKRDINQGQYAFSGATLADRHSDAPAGYYTNADTSYTGIVLRDTRGNCTYFDRTHGLVYAFEGNIWQHNTFIRQSTMSSISVKLID